MQRSSSGPVDSAPIIAVGASGAEGLNDIKELLCALPNPLAAIVLVVLHRPVDCISHLRDILARACHFPVVIAEDGQRLDSGVCYIGKPDGHLTLASRHYALLIDDPEDEYRNRTIDALFRSLAAQDGSLVIGVILSGSLDDGSLGLAAIKAAGGITMVRSPSNKRHPGMPENARAHNAPVDKIGTPKQIAQEIGYLLRLRNWSSTKTFRPQYYTPTQAEGTSVCSPAGSYSRRR